MHGWRAECGVAERSRNGQKRGKSSENEVLCCIIANREQRVREKRGIERRRREVEFVQWVSSAWNRTEVEEAHFQPTMEAVPGWGAGVFRTGMESAISYVPRTVRQQPRCILFSVFDQKRISRESEEREREREKREEKMMVNDGNYGQ